MLSDGTDVVEVGISQVIIRGVEEDEEEEESVRVLESVMVDTPLVDVDDDDDPIDGAVLLSFSFPAETLAL